jgi:hypothetical protein
VAAQTPMVVAHFCGEATIKVTHPSQAKEWRN